MFNSSYGRMCLPDSFLHSRGLALAAIMLIAATSTSAAASADSASKTPWLRPASENHPLIWGHRDGLVFGLPSDGGMRGPQGLIRVGVLSTTGTPLLINFIAIEPVVKGSGPRHTRLALSELEMSELDPDRRGKRLWTSNPTGELTTAAVTLDGPTTVVELLRVPIEVERFTANGAHVHLVAVMRSDRPEELQLEVYHHEDSAPIDELTVTATMGNKERLRQLWLRDGVVDSRDLYEGYKGTDFVEKESYPASKLPTWLGAPIAIATTNESDPASVHVAQRPSWNYPAHKLTQYWRAPEVHVEDDLRVRVNGRRVYWAGTIPIPGGLSFENFELRQDYVPGQVFVFGMTPASPQDFLPPVTGLPAIPK